MEPTIIHLVDSLEYAYTNCFQHQLAHALKKDARVRTVPLSVIAMQTHGFNPVVCCLKQRTLHAHLDKLADVIKQAPVTIYEQDPWEAVRDGSPYKGVFERAVQKLNVKSINVTAPFWAQVLRDRGLPTQWVHMWILPDYCSSEPAYVDRKIELGFVGGLHPYRKQLFDRLTELGYPVTVQSGNTLPYNEYLNAVSQIGIYIHAEEAAVIADGQELNLRDGLFGRTIEVSARGCFDIRNRGRGFDEYGTIDGRSLKNVFFYDKPEDIPAIIDRIRSMDPVERQNILNESVDLVKSSRMWDRTAQRLLEF